MAKQRTMISGRVAWGVLSWLHLMGILAAFGGLFFMVVNLLPARGAIAEKDWGSLAGATLTIFLPIHWLGLVVVITTGILKIFEHLTKIQDMGPALGTIYGKTVLTKMLIGSFFLTNGMVITGILVGKVPLGNLLFPLLYVQVACGLVMIAFGAALRNVAR